MAVNTGYSVVWSPQAIKTFDTILEYIQKNFSDKDVQNFVRKTDRIINHIVINPKLFRVSQKDKSRHIVVITKQTTLFYRLKKGTQQVELLLFWDTRQNPKKLKL